jgi:starch synthase
MKVLYLAAEATPLAKVGGLADVAGELPQEMARSGIDIRLCLPLHTTIDRTQYRLKSIASVEVAFRDELQWASVFETRVGGVVVWLVDGAPVSASPGIYHQPAKDAAKYTFTNLAVFGVCEALDWIPDILHANDWHAAVSVMFLNKLRVTDARWNRTGSLFTVHNLFYMGAGVEQVLVDYHVPVIDSSLLPDWARNVPLPQGILQADWVSTVSPTYASEVRTPEFSGGLETLLNARAETLSGILNGIEPEAWDPGTDQAIRQRFGIDTLPERSVNKAALQSELGLEVDPHKALIGMVSRLDSQKGIDLVWPALVGLDSAAWQFVLLGQGDPELEQHCRVEAEKQPERARAILRFDPLLARRIYAGADMLLIPSRYEPCGLAQMIAMRYGCVPVVRATGGLMDTVKDQKTSKNGTGFFFHEITAVALQQAIKQAINCFQMPEGWQQLQRNGMKQDFSWTQPARDYIDLYQLVGARYAE